MATRRDKIEEILTNHLQTRVGPELVGQILGELMALDRVKGTNIIHRIGPNGYHQLIVDEEKTHFAPPTDILRINRIVASTDAYVGVLPQIGIIYELREKDFRTEAVQTLNSE